MEVEIEDDLEQFIKTVILIVIALIGLSTIALLVAIVITAINEHLQELNEAASRDDNSGGGSDENESDALMRRGDDDEVSPGRDDTNNVSPVRFATNSGTGTDDSDAAQLLFEQSRKHRSVSQSSDGSGISSMRIATNEVSESLHEDSAGRKRRIISRRGAFVWLPVACSNDLVHGSYWFLFGSIFYTVISIVPVYMDLNFASFIDELKYRKMSDIELREESATFSLFSISGLLFSLGSIAFIRATEERAMSPLFPNYYHINTDELLAAWLFLLGTIPFPFSIIVLLYYNPSYILLWLFLLMSSSVVFSSYLFVISCYPGQVAVTNQEMIPNFLKYFCKSDYWIFKHLSNDWLAGCWFFYISTFMITIGSFIIFIYFYIYDYNGFLDSFIWGSSTIDCIIFLIGGAYFVAGSYEQQGDNFASFTLFQRRQQHTQQQQQQPQPQPKPLSSEETFILEEVNKAGHYGSIN